MQVRIDACYTPRPTEQLFRLVTPRVFAKIDLFQVIAVDWRDKPSSEHRRPAVG